MYNTEESMINFINSQINKSINTDYMNEEEHRPPYVFIQYKFNNGHTHYKNSSHMVICDDLECCRRNSDITVDLKLFEEVIKKMVEEGKLEISKRQLCNGDYLFCNSGHKLCDREYKVCDGECYSSWIYTKQ